MMQIHFQLNVYHLIFNESQFFLVGPRAKEIFVDCTEYKIYDKNGRVVSLWKKEEEKEILLSIFCLANTLFIQYTRFKRGSPNPVRGIEWMRMEKQRI